MVASQKSQTHSVAAAVQIHEVFRRPRLGRSDRYIIKPSCFPALFYSRPPRGRPLSRWWLCFLHTSGMGVSKNRCVGPAAKHSDCMCNCRSRPAIPVQVTYSSLEQYFDVPLTTAASSMVSVRSLYCAGALHICMLCRWAGEFSGLRGPLQGEEAPGCGPWTTWVGFILGSWGTSELCKRIRHASASKCRPTQRTHVF
jgi:hypothetical protein